MAEQQHSKWRLRRGQYLGEISALCFLRLPAHPSRHPFLLAGTGSQLLLYSLDSGKLIESFEVFDGIRVHGITNFVEESKSPSPISCAGIVFEIAVFGEKRAKLFKLSIWTVLESGSKATQVSANLALLHSLPKFSHWVLDVSFFKSNDKDGSHCLVVGCSDNSVHLWDISRCSVVLQVQSPERCLLYSMRLLGDNLEALRIASGTIYNEIIVWKVIPQGHPHDYAPPLSPSEDGVCLSNSFSSSFQLHGQQHQAAHICRLVGHEGSIFRIAWSSDGSKLVSVSDDRSARIWAVGSAQSSSDNFNKEADGPVLFGHTARVWDCCISSSLIITAGEDCTCRVWGLDGKQIKMIKEHIGRGVWRCLYDPDSSILVTAGFDSAIKVHHLQASFPQSWEGKKPFTEKTVIVTGQIPNLTEHNGLMNSKSEYVRCLRFAKEDTLYVATNRGYLYQAKLFQMHDLRWTKLSQLSEEVPVVCMDLLSRNSPQQSCSVDDWIALGDGRGNMTIARVVGDVCTPKVDFTFKWSAGKERQLLGTYWCKSLGYRFIFTADPRGIVKLWKLHESILSATDSSERTFDVSFIAEFASCFGVRIMCLDASVKDEILVCGDLRGNLMLFPLPNVLLLDTPAEGGINVSPLTYFKGAHGISTVSSISVAKLNSNDLEIHSTGGDGCICHLEYGRDRQSLEFIGMKQVKELSLIQSVSADENFPNDLADCGYAVGFASTNFIIWNLATEAKVLQIPCGGWRRPFAYHLGDLPEMQNCLAFVKDEIIYIHRQWVMESERKMFPQNLHIQFHGREMHSLCFISENRLAEASVASHCFGKSSWIATGCEDGTVRLTRHASGVEHWFTSKLLGEHVGGSAVRSICSVSKMHEIASDKLSDGRNKAHASANDVESPFLLISVGAKRVLTSWLMRNRRLGGKEKSFAHQHDSMSFKWLSTDMPAKNCSNHGKTKTSQKVGVIAQNLADVGINSEPKSFSTESMAQSNHSSDDKYEDDWRYLAVTAFVVKCTGSRLIVCFVVVACSDATLALRALVLPHRLWFDVALLVPLSSPVLALQHVIIPVRPPGEEFPVRNVYIVISGATDGSIAFWDLTDGIETFMDRLSALDLEKSLNCHTRPRTGRGSQGGRWWKTLGSKMSVKGSGNASDTLKAGQRANSNLVNPASHAAPEVNGQAESLATGMSSDAESFTAGTVSDGEIVSTGKPCDTESWTAASSLEDNTSLGPIVNNVNSLTGICEVLPLHVFKDVHQSGVNCLHVSDTLDCQNSDNGFLFSVISGGDDQALHCLKFDFPLLSPVMDSNIVISNSINLCTESENMKCSLHPSQCQIVKYRIRFLNHDRVTSAHSSAIKGVWTDGNWVFSTGLDQRIRCWLITEDSKLTAQANLIISVPEPETLHARSYGRNHYEIAVAGRGMQTVDFSAT